MKKSFILIAALVVLVMLAGCNADQISGFGKSMEKLGDAGLGTQKNGPMKEATEKVNTFIENSEENFKVVPEGNFDTPVVGYPDKYDAYLDFNGSEAPNKYIENVDNTVKALLAAKDSSARSKDLRSALNAKYTGKSSNVASYRNLHEGLAHERNLAGLALRHIDPDIPGNRENVVMILRFMLGVEVEDITKEDIDKIRNGIQMLKDIDLPFPVQSGDYYLLIGKLLSKVQSVVESIKSSSGGSGGKKIDTSALNQFRKDLASSVGERDYQTVGDKIMVGVVFSLLNTIIDIDNAFRADPEYYDPTAKSYDKFFNFLLGNEKGLTYVDKMLNYLDAISYIYDVKLDMAGLVSGLI